MNLRIFSKPQLPKAFNVFMKKFACQNQVRYKNQRETYAKTAFYAVSQKRNRMRLKQTPESRSIYSLSNSPFFPPPALFPDTDACAQLATLNAFWDHLLFTLFSRSFNQRTKKNQFSEDKQSAGLSTLNFQWTPDYASLTMSAALI